MSPRGHAPFSLHATSSLSLPSSDSLLPTPCVDLACPPNQEPGSEISGNAPRWVKQLNGSTFTRFGVGHEDCFARAVGKRVKFVEVNVDQDPTRQGRMEATTVAEVKVTRDMLNGAGILHGGCIAYLIDICCSTPLVILGLLRDINGVGVTQSLNILFHSPVSFDTHLQIRSTSISLGSRVMSSRCEIITQESGRIVASALLNKMQPSSDRCKL